MLPNLVAHLLLCGLALGWTLHRLRTTTRAWPLFAGVGGVTAFGVALAAVTGPGPGLAGGFALLLGWAWTLGIVTPLSLVALGIDRVRRRRRFGWRVLGSAVPIVAVTVYAFAIEPRLLEVTRETVVSDRVDTPLRIAVIADLQADSPGAYEAAALRAVMAERPDVIVLPGDFVQQADPQRYAQGWAALRAIVAEVGVSAPLGVYAVGGDVEHAGWEAQLAGTGFVALQGPRRVRPDVRLVGLDLIHSRRGAAVARTDGAFSVVVGHAPDFALGPVDADLLVAGHTHGGQVQLPGFGPLVTLSAVPRAWASGRTQIDEDTTLVVSRGVGMERGAAPRLRLACRPQVVIVDVVPR